VHIPLLVLRCNIHTNYWVAGGVLKRIGLLIDRTDLRSGWSIGPLLPVRLDISVS
jgi:hypothetical protein